MFGSGRIGCFVAMAARSFPFVRVQCSREIGETEKVRLRVRIGGTVKGVMRLELWLPDLLSLSAALDQSFTKPPKNVRSKLINLLTARFLPSLLNGSAMLLLLWFNLSCLSRSGEILGLRRLAAIDPICAPDCEADSVRGITGSMGG